jgi:hypothetical protein
MKLTKMFKAAALLGAVGTAAIMSGCAMNQTSALNGMKAGGHEYLLTVTRPN